MFAQAFFWSASGVFDAQIVPVPVRVRRETVDFVRDEHIREDVTAEGLTISLDVPKDTNVVAATKRQPRDASPCG